MPQKNQPCVVPGCPNRTGRVYDGPARVADGAEQVADNELRAAERDLEHARQLYSAVVGLSGRMHWRRKIDEGVECVRLLREKAAAEGLTGSTQRRQGWRWSKKVGAGAGAGQRG